MRRSSCAALVSALAVLGSVLTSTASAAASSPAPDAAGASVVFTPTTMTEPLGDNKFRLTSYSGLAFRKDKAGKWSRTSTDVVETADPEQPLAAPSTYTPVKFGADPKKLLELDWDGAPLVMSAPSFAKVKPVKDGKDGKKVHYKAVGKDVDVEYEVGTGSVKELIVLRSPAAARSFTFHLADPTGRLGEALPTGDGGIEFTAEDAHGLRLTLPPAVAYELPEGDALPDLENGSATQTVTRAGDGFDITLAVDEQWLASKSFPIVLDPTLSVSSPSGAGDCWLENGTHASTSMCAQSLVAGINATELSRTVVRFNMSSIEGINAYIHTANFTIWQSGTACVNTTPCDQTVALRAVKAGSLNGWNFNNTATWSRYRTDVGTDGATGAAPTWGNVGVSDGGGPDSCCADIATFSTPHNTTARVQRSFDTANYPALRDLVQGWADVPASNHGFHLRGSGTVQTKYVKFDNRQQTTPASISVTYTPPASAPTNVFAYERNSALEVHWTPPANASDAAITGYRTFAYPTNGGATVTQVCAAPTTTCTVYGLTNGVGYNVAVQAFSSPRDGQISGQAGTYTPFGPPNAVLSPNASVTAAPGQAQVSWSVDNGTPGTANGRAITGFTVTTRTVDGAGNRSDVKSEGCSSTCAITGLTNGQQYDFKIVASNAAGAGSPAYTPVVRPYDRPDQAQNVTADVTPSPGQARITWTGYSLNNTGAAPRDNGAWISSYLVKTYLTGTGTPGRTDVTCSSQPCDVGGLSNGTSYQFTLIARNARGDSTESARSGAATPYDYPTAPTSVTASDTRAASTADVSWSQGGNGGSAVTQWYVTPFTMPARSAGTQRTCTASPCAITGLANAQAYVFAVRAVNSRGASGFSADSNQVTPYDTPAKPTGVTVDVDTAKNQAGVRWTVPFDGGRPILDSTVTATPSNGGALITRTCSTPPTQEPCTVTGLQNATSYAFTVTARNVRGTGPASDAVNATPYDLPSAPAAPTADPAPAAGALSVTYAPPASNGGSPILRYLVRAYPAAAPAGSRTAAAENECTGTTCTLAPLTNGSAYVVTVAAINKRGTGAQSADSAPATPYGAPAAPQTATAAPGDGAVTIGWTAPASDGGRPVDRYDITLFRASDGAQLATTTAAADARSKPMAAPNGTAVYATVAAHNLRDTGEATTTNTVLPLLPVGLDKTVNQTGTVRPGDLLTYTLRLTNDNPISLSGVRLTDPLPSGATLVVAVEQKQGSAYVPCDGCTVTNNTLTYTPPSLTASSTTELRYTLQAADAPSVCQTLPNTATVTDTLGARTDAADVVRCDAGLGLEPWWTFTRTQVGDQAELAVNAANGNAVLQAVDSTPVQAHGRLSLLLRRTYNSQAQTVATLPGSLGARWQLNLGEASDAAGLDSTGSALVVPAPSAALDTLLTPLGVTLVDRDGTRHLFKPRAVPAADVVDVTTLTGAAGSLKPTALPLGTGPVCLDLAYDAPKGVHLGLWRYVQLRTAGATCQGGIDRADDPVLIGYTAVRPDRLRSEYDETGRLRALVDGSGVTLAYRYDPAGRLEAVWEKNACPGGVYSPDLTCRQIRLAYTPSGAAVPAVTVTDPAGRDTRYELDRDLPTAPGQPVAHLVKVVDPDQKFTSYAYGGCGGSADQLCTITDRRGNTTALHYTPAAGLDPALAPARVDAVTDRRATTTAVTYARADDGTGTTTVRSDNTSTGPAADQTTPSRRRVYSGIDSDGRVHTATLQALVNGSAGPALHTTSYGWDTAGCRLRDSRPDNNLCALTRSNSGPAGDETTRYQYTPTGPVAVEARRLTATTDLSTTWGYRTQYVGTAGVSVVTDDAAGGGTVTPGAATGPTSTSDALYALTDQVQMLTPRGNAAADPAPYLTTYTADALETAPAGADITSLAGTGGEVCATAGAGGDSPPQARSNTGLRCQTSGPSSTADDRPTVTRAVYDRHGQKTRATSPKAVHEAEPGQTPAATVYRYFTDGDRDITGTVNAGGWLRQVFDPTSTPTAERYVAFDVDAAGNTVRSWDRDSTAGQPSSNYPGPLAAARTGITLPRAAQTFLNVDAAGTPTHTAPWRHVLVSIDPSGNRTDSTVDANGNITAVRPPRGTAAGSSTYDVTSTFDAGDLLTATATPRQRAENTSTRHSYDPFGNRTSTAGPREPGETADRRVTVWRYDAADRVTATLTSRGSNDATTGSCTLNTGTLQDDPAPIAVGRWFCTTSTSYDQVDNATGRTDADGQRWETDFDAVHRPVTSRAPRTRGAAPTLATRTLHDADGRPLTVCSPRQTGACTASSTYATHTSYDPAGRATVLRRYRDAATALDTVTSYDADGNPVRVTDPRGTSDGAVTDTTFQTEATYDLLGRRLTLTTPRAGISRYAYTPSGDLLARGTPGTATDNPGGPALRITGYTYDANHRVVDTVTALQASSFTTGTLTGAAGSALTSSTEQRNLRTRVQYDPDGHIVASWTPRAFTTSAGTGTAALLANPDDRFRTSTSYDTDGRQESLLRPRADDADSDLNLPAGLSTTQCPAGADGYPAGVRVCRTDYSYDLAGNLTAVALPTRTGNATDPGSTARTLRYGYTDDNLRSTVTGPSPAAGATGTGSITLQELAFDGAGRPTSSTDALTRTTAVAYTADGLVAELTRPGGPNGLTHRTEFGYDPDGRRVVVGTPRTTYNADGAATGQQTPQTLTAYTPDGLVASVTTGHVAGQASNSGDLVTSYTYDRAGNPDTVTSPEANARGRSNPAGEPVRYTHTPDSLLAQVRQPVLVTAAGAVQTRQTDYTYNPAGDKTAVHVQLTGTGAADGGTQTFSYYPTGQLNTQTGRNNETIAHTYDADGNPVDVASSGSAADLTGTFYADGLPRTATSTSTAGVTSTAYSYDGAGDLLGRVSTTGTTTRTTTYTRNAAGVPVEMAEPAGTTGWTHNALGQPLTAQRPNGTSQTWDYRSDHLLASTAVTAGGATLSNWTYSYDELGRQLTQAYSGTAAASINPASLLDPASALGSGPVGTDTAPATPVTYRSTYDAAGRLSSFTDARGTRTLVFDRNSNRVDYGTTGQPGATHFDYRADDSIEASTTTVRTVVAGVNVDTPTTRAYSYEPFGGVTSDGCAQNTYDGFDRLTAVNAPASVTGCPARGSVTYTYDGLDRQHTRSQTTSSGSGAVSTSTVRHGYDGWTGTVTQESATGSVPGTVDYTLDATGTPATAEQNGTREFLAGDGTGSTGLATTTGGAVRCTARYDAYGNADGNNPVLTPAGSCNSGQSISDVFYRANRKDTATGAYQLGSRTYDPSKGGFLTPDSYRTGGSAANTSVGVDPVTRNTYAYVNGDPINYADPSGHSPTEAGSNYRANGYLRDPVTGESHFIPGGVGAHERRAFTYTGLGKGIANYAAGGASGVANTLKDGVEAACRGSVLGVTGACGAIKRIPDAHLCPFGKTRQGGIQCSIGEAVGLPLPVAAGVRVASLAKLDRLEGGAAARRTSDEATAAGRPRAAARTAADSGTARTTILGENMSGRVQPFADATGSRTLGFGSTADEWNSMSPAQRWRLNDGQLRARINEGDDFRYIGQDADRSPLLRQQFDLTRSELLRLEDRGIPFDFVSPDELFKMIGRF